MTNPKLFKIKSEKKYRKEFQCIVTVLFNLFEKKKKTSQNTTNGKGCKGWFGQKSQYCDNTGFTQAQDDFHQYRV